MGRNVDNIGGLAQAAANVATPINRRNIRFLDGGGITWSVVDDPGNNEVEVSASAGGGASPPGAVTSFAGTVVPAGWLECDGTSYTTASQAALFAAIGYTWGGAGPNFNVPDFRRRTPVGRGGTGTGTLGNVVGNVGGGETHALATAEGPNHTHGDYGHIHNVPDTAQAPFGFCVDGGPGSSSFPVLASNRQINGNVYYQSGLGYANMNFSGNNVPHNNMQPSAVVMVIIKA